MLKLRNSIATAMVIALIASLPPVVKNIAFGVDQGQGQGAEEATNPPDAPPGKPPATDEPAAELPPGVMAKLNGRDVTVREYADYLLASIGKGKLDQYIDRLLIEQEARRLSIAVTSEEVEAFVEAQNHRTVQGLYQGDKDRFLQALAHQGTSLEERNARLRQQIYYRELLHKVIVKGRTISDEDVKAEFTKTYGPGGVRQQIRHILVSTRKRTGRGGKLLDRSEEEARKRAEKVLEAIKAGADFVDQVKKYSDDTLTRQNDGRIVPYRVGDYGEEFDQAVKRLSEKRPQSGVIRSPRGFHVVQWIGKDVDRLEDVRESLEAELREAPATVRERSETLTRLRAAAEIVR